MLTQKQIQSVVNSNLIFFIGLRTRKIKKNCVISDLKNEDSVEIFFEFTDDQIRMRKDVFNRWGKDINAVSKIVTRIDNLESQFRKVRFKGDNYLRDIYKKIGDTNIRYSLSS